MGGLLHQVQSASVAPAAKLAVNPHSRAGLSYTVGSTVTFEVNITNAPAIGGVFVTLSYNFTVLHITNLDITGNVLGVTDPFQECVPEIGINIGPGCSISTGEVNVFLVLQHANTTAPTNGRVFQMTFSVGDVGFSELHLFDSYFGAGTSLFPLVLYDGYFTNRQCGSALCTPPVTSFTVSPSILGTDNVSEVAEGQPVLFDASKSNATNKGATITLYSYDWGDGTPGLSNVPSRNATHTYALNQASNVETVTVIARDSYGIPGSKTILLRIIFNWIDLAIGDPNAQPHQEVVAGTIVNITTTLKNLSVRSENATVEVRVGTLSLQNYTFTNMPPNTKRQVSLNWDTTGSSPKVYKVEAIADPVRNSTTGQVIENDTSNNLGVTFVQLVEPIPSGYGTFLGLGLIPASLSFALLAGVAGGAVSFLRRRRPPAETLA
jgi:hypothetical protein